MTIPPLDPVYPLQSAALSEDRLPSDGSDPAPFLIALVKQAFSLIRSSDGWKKGKTYGDDDPAKGGSVQYLSCPSDMAGRLKKCGWHARFSQHKPAEAGISFEDMFEGLGTDQHALNEKEYIHDIIEVKNVCTVVPGKALVWQNSYTLPAPTTNRDFVELVVTLPLPPSPAPFSAAHEEVVCQQLASSSGSGLPDHPGPASTQSRRSFLNISLPVAHSNAPAQPGFVRGMYASVEAVWEGQRHKAVAEAGPGETQPQPQVEWFMAVQSDSGGKIPLFMQEMAMPSKISQDVPLFFDWARKKSQQNNQPQP